MITEIISIGALAASGYCIVAGTLYNRARKRLDRATKEYFGVVHSSLQQASQDSLSDQVQMCGGCGGYFPQSTLEKCPGKTCENFHRMLAERNAS